MPSFISKRAATLCAIAAVAVFSQAASAATVLYSTTGSSFGSAAPGTPFVSTVSNAFGTYTVTYTPMVDQFETPSVISLGTFTATAVATQGENLSDTFNLDIDQFLPNPGTVNKIGSLSGILTATSSGVSISFTDLFIGSIPGINGGSTNYNLTTLETFIPNGAPGATLQGRVTSDALGVVPLPPAMLAGGALLGTMGFSRLRRLVSRTA